MAKRVTILGAGFSHAICSEMPMTNLLADKVLDKLRADGVDVPTRSFTGGQFEAWLSRLAEPQPDLDAARNADNRALFIRISRVLRDVMMECQNNTYRVGPPWWLRRLIGVLHFSNSTALTFNYDMLIEATLRQASLFDQGGRRVRPDDIVRNMPHLVLPPAADGGFRISAGSADTFRYIKLHGSLDTFWVIGDTAGETIARWGLAGNWDTHVIESNERRQQALPGRDPFVVPPTATKTAFYANPLSRQLWQDAAAALREADEVALLGYSIPVTDMVSSGMLSEALGPSAARVTVVNPYPDGVRSRLVDLGIDAARIDCIDGLDACERYVERCERLFTPGISASVPGAALPCAVGDGGSTYQVENILEVTSDGTAVLLAGEAWRNSSYARTTGRFVSLQDIAAIGPATRARVVWPTGEEAYVTRAETQHGFSGADESMLLMVTAMPRIEP